MPGVVTRARPDFPRRDAELRERMDDPDCDLGALRRTYARFDVVISNDLLHHLDPEHVQELVSDSERLARRLVVHNDLVRSPGAYRLYSVGVLPLTPGSFLRTDGLRSLRRAYVPHELRSLAGPRWSVRPGTFAHQQLVRDRSLPVQTRPPR